MNIIQERIHTHTHMHRHTHLNRRTYEPPLSEQENETKREDLTKTFHTSIA